MDGKIFEKLIEVSECAFFISKPGGEMEITYASKKFYSILQYTKEEFQEVIRFMRHMKKRKNVQN